MMRWLIASAATLALLGGGYAALTHASAPTEAVDASELQPVDLTGLHMVVHKSPTCGCCGDWIDVMRAQGIEVTEADTDDIVSIKVEHGVPNTAYSCHTAVIEGYAVEGHVPVAAITQLLTDRPDVQGIALGGMPQGSPGMTGVQTAPFEVVAYAGDDVTVFGRY